VDLGANARYSPVMRRLIVIAFGVIQLILTARLAIDFGMLPSDGDLPGMVISLSEALASPIQLLADAIGIDFGGIPGAGMDPTILTALIGWSIIEAIVLMIFGRSG
jgi:disulfide bond formation protein DsbB